MKAVIKTETKTTLNEANELSSCLTAKGIENLIIPCESGFVVTWAQMEKVMPAPNRKLLIALGDWLQDNYDGGYDTICFAQGDNERITSEQVYPVWERVIAPLLVDVSDDELQQHVFVVVGRVCDCEDELKFVMASTKEEAEGKFNDYIKVKQDWDGESDIYVEFTERLADFSFNLLK
ncbi:hypothetical protein [Pseudoalteromonas lipolytica]|jgi:hypothetical protein|uniref:hypothetical protein n=1 Tax=Pseudoalteromonas lipolytica TaxID=570156 RepID=UPI003A976AAA